MWKRFNGEEKPIKIISSKEDTNDVDMFLNGGGISSAIKED